MFDIGASELLLTVIVAIVVIGPKDLPLALRTAGRWLGKIRRVSGHFRQGIENMIREAELEEMEKKWREQNEAIMKASGSLPGASAEAGAGIDPAFQPAPETSAAVSDPDSPAQPAQAGAEEKVPQLPLSPP
jgi:sec-independent protein translocase protein TatB